MKTPEEIKKGLECCWGTPCKCWECPYDLNDGADCDGFPNADALLYIEQLEQEVEQAVQVVRCGRCAHWGKSPLGHSEEMLGWCKIAGEHHKPDYYCASGRRKE